MCEHSKERVGGWKEGEHATERGREIKEERLEREAREGEDGWVSWLAGLLLSARIVSKWREGARETWRVKDVNREQSTMGGVGAVSGGSEERGRKRD